MTKHFRFFFAALFAAGIASALPVNHSALTAAKDMSPCGAIGCVDTETDITTLDAQLVASGPLANVEESFATKIVKELATGALQGAGGEAGRVAFGALLSVIGFDDPATSTKTLELVEENNKLLKDIKTELGEIKDEIADAVAEIEKAVETAEYREKVATVRQVSVVAIEALRDQLQQTSVLWQRELADELADPAKVGRVEERRQEAKELADQILDSHNVRFFLAGIHDALMDGGTDKGLLSMWAGLSWASMPQNRADVYSNRVYQHFMYFYSIQVSGLQLVMKRSINGTQILAIIPLRFTMAGSRTSTDSSTNTAKTTWAGHSPIFRSSISRRTSVGPTLSS